MAMFKKKSKLHPYEVHLIIVILDGDVRKYVEKLVEEEVEGEWEAGFVNINDDYYLILNKEKLSHNVIAHETQHIVDAISKNKGMGIDESESRAMLSGHIAEQTYKLIKHKDLGRAIK